MRTRMTACLLVAIFCAAGCSMPSMPALPWSGPTADASRSAEALYADGMRYFKEKRYARAIDSLSKIKTDHPFSPLLIDAELKVADAYYLNQQYPEAIAAFKEFQSLHPNNENIPFVVFRLGQSHFDQFTATDREQKNTEIAKGYFETVVNNYAKSPVAPQAREKLAKCIEYLSEYDFNVANFYFQQEKYAAARDRFEEIVRKYNRTPAAEKSLFFLGESYRKEKNNIRAGLAYEALLQHYPEGKFTREAKIQLAQLDKDRQDPLAMLLMRDRRSGPTGAADVPQDIARPKEIPNLVAKTDVVYEEPGQDKGVFRRVVDKINPFSSSDDGKKKVEEKKPESAIDLMAKRKAAEKESPGMLSRLWPFGSDEKNDTKKQKPADGKSTQLVDQVDKNLQGKGVDSKVQTAALRAPASDIAKLAGAPRAQPSDTSKLLGDIDANLKKSGASTNQLPAPPEAAPVFRNPVAAQAAVASATKAAEQPKSPGASGLLGSIDQKLKGQGLEPAKFEPAPQIKPDTSRQAAPKTVELEPKLPQEKGPLFLAPGVIPAQEKATLAQTPTPDEKKAAAAELKPVEPASREFARSLVKGPTLAPAAQVANQKPAAAKSPASGGEESKGAFDQLKQDIDSIGKALNPFRW